MLTDETGHVFPHTPHIFTEKKKNPQCPEYFKFHGYVLWNQMDQFLETLAKGGKMSNILIINPRFVFWKLNFPGSTTDYKINSSSRKGSIKHIYKTSAFELIK